MAFPQAKIGWIVEQRWQELLSSKVEIGGQVLPFVDTIHQVDTRGWRKRLIDHTTLAEIRASFREVRDRCYEVVVDFQGAIKSGIIAALSSAPRRYGFADAWERPASLFYTNKINAKSYHVVQRNN